MNNTYPNAHSVYKKRIWPVNMRVHGHTAVYYPHSKSAHSLAMAIALYLRGRLFSHQLIHPNFLLI
jgi:hypothetical protein